VPASEPPCCTGVDATQFCHVVTVAAFLQKRECISRCSCESFGDMCHMTKAHGSATDARPFGALGLAQKPTKEVVDLLAAH